MCLVSNNHKERSAKSPQATSQGSSQSNVQAAMRAPSPHLLSLPDALLPLLETSDKKMLHKSTSWNVDVLILALPSHLHTETQQVLGGERTCQISNNAILFRTGWQECAWILVEYIISSAHLYAGYEQVLNCNNKIHLLPEI